MSDFFELDNGAPAAAVMERQMRLDERNREARRRLIGLVLAVAVVCSVLLGGGYAAYASRASAAKKVAGVAAAKHLKNASTKHSHKKKSHA